MIRIVIVLTIILKKVSNNHMKNNVNISINKTAQHTCVTPICPVSYVHHHPKTLHENVMPDAIHYIVCSKMPRHPKTHHSTHVLPLRVP